ncbi:MAG: hypothetical protein ACM3JB_16950 [Acidobacteriaceae bacterium]
MPEVTRDVAGGGGLGGRRYQRYVAAFDWVLQCVNAGHNLEAIAILDSLICDRLASRLGHLTGRNIGVSLTCRQLCTQLLTQGSSTGYEEDPEFREAVTDIRMWGDRRNVALHSTAKVFRSDDSPESFAAILQSHKQDALDGIKYLQVFDELDTANRAQAGKYPASYPNAFFPERRGGRNACEVSETRK